MLELPITSIIAASLALIMIPLTVQISMRRASLGMADGELTKYVFGHGNDDALQCRIRAFGNFVEYVPIALLMFALIEIQGAGQALLWALGIVFVFGRILHAVGTQFFAHTTPLPRILGMFATYAALIVPAVWMFIKYWG